MNKVFYWLAAFIVVAVVAIGLMRDKPANNDQDSQDLSIPDKEEADAQSADESLLEVVYNGTAFVPSSLTIKPGTIVTFKNTGTDLMWVASDPHPLHTDNSEFDAKRGYATSEDYAFTFTAAGSYGFHNHLNPSATGLITVR